MRARDSFPGFSLCAESPFVLVGTPDEVVAKLHRLRERLGFSYFTVPRSAAADLAPLLPALRGADPAA